MPMPVDTSVIDWPAGDTAARVLGASHGRRDPLSSLLLRSLAVPYRAAIWLHNSAFDLGVRRPQRASVPVISVGNIVAGGSGKTPFTRWLVDELSGRGRRVAILHGGYGSDEPELHRKWHPHAIVIADKDRVRAAGAAAQQGAEIIVLDDAFQHRRIARDLDIVLVPVETPSARMLPAGPRREPDSALARADLIVITRKTANTETAHKLAVLMQRRCTKPCAVVAMLPAGFSRGTQSGVALTGSALVVAAVARPDLLLQQLRNEHIEVAKMLAYPDHHDYTAADRDQIRQAASGQPIVTTEKDAIKLRSLFDPRELWVLEQRLVIESGAAAITELIEQVL
jgi:tetraacyldisaccharide 4'-kinase